MTGGDQRDVVTLDQFEERRTRWRLYRPIAGIAFVRTFDEQRPVREPGDLASIGRRERLTQPFELASLFIIAAAEEHRIEPDQPPILDIARPPVSSEMSPPAIEPLGVHRLMRIARFADVVIAGDREKRRLQRAHER